MVANVAYIALQYSRQHGCGYRPNQKFLHFHYYRSLSLPHNNGTLTNNGSQIHTTSLQIPPHPDMPPYLPLLHPPPSPLPSSTQTPTLQPPNPLPLQPLQRPLGNRPKSKTHVRRHLPFPKERLELPEEREREHGSDQFVEMGPRKVRFAAG